MSATLFFTRLLHFINVDCYFINRGPIYRLQHITISGVAIGDVSVNMHRQLKVYLVLSCAIILLLRILHMYFNPGRMNGENCLLAKSQLGEQSQSENHGTILDINRRDSQANCE